MANWYQRKPAIDAKLAMLLRFGQTDVVIAALELAQARCEADADVVPTSVEPYMVRLVELGLATSTSETLHFLRQKRRHRGGTTENHVAPGGTTENHVAPDKIRKDKIGEEKKKRAPRVPKPSEDGWAPKQDHIDIAKERGLDLNTEVTAMLDWLKASGKTYKDYDAFARNWLRRANPRPAQVKRPNLSNNLLQTNDHPEGAGEEYWLAGINKYGGNHG
jgi:hypothetical protein